MSLLLTAVFVLLVGFSFSCGYLVPLILQTIGSHLHKRSIATRELVLQRARAEDERCSSKLRSPQNNDPSNNDDDEDGTSESVDPEPTLRPHQNNLTRSSDFAGLIGFFHPFCNAGGGGERVLWAAIRATQNKWPKAVCVVYTGDHELQKAAMIERIFHSFGISLYAPTLTFFYLSTRHLVNASRYPYFTLLGQSLGSLALIYDAFNLVVPDILIDTMGYAFSLAFAKYLFPALPVGAYVHYPTISTDMLGSLNDSSGQKGVNAGAGAGLRGAVKEQYWRWFARLYGWAGSHVDLVMCNSTWTKGHIDSLWKTKASQGNFAKIMYPPCPVKEMKEKIEVSFKSEQNRKRQIVYIAQFRPEKNHTLILESFARCLRALPAYSPSPQLILLGSVRNNGADELHIYNLRLQARDLSIADHTEFITDSPYDTILEYLQSASIGTNGMWNEHFGIGVVEYLASGVIPVVHDSGGPKLDIVVPVNDKRTGYHAETVEQFADSFRAIFELSAEERFEMRRRGREQAEKFAEDVFAEKWIEEMARLVLKAI